jgi:hypothetical protein
MLWTFANTLQRPNDRKGLAALVTKRIGIASGRLAIDLPGSADMRLNNRSNIASPRQYDLAQFAFRDRAGLMTSVKGF